MENKQTKLTLKVKGMHCISCVQKVEKYFASLENIKADVNLTLEQVEFSYIGDQWDIASINESLRVLGYRGTLLGDDKKTLGDYIILTELWVAIGIALLLMGPHMINAFAGLFDQNISFPSFMMDVRFQFGSAFISQFVIGRRFYIGAWRSIKQRVLGMDLLIIIGTTTAFVYSFINWVNSDFMTNAHHINVYFDISAEVIAFIMVGKVIEKKVQDGSKKALMSKLSAKPETAWLITPEGNVRTKVSALEIGQKIIVKKGERIPIDGKLITSNAYIDESMITGESIVISKKDGDSIIGSTINVGDAFEIEVTTLDQDSVMSGIIKQITSVSNEKPPIQKIADRASNIFIPFILGVGLLTFIVWSNWSFPSLGIWEQETNAVVNSLAVLIIACPCMLGLATPMAMLVGSTLSSNKGIIFNKIDAFEKVKKIDAICFDKTGTITEGKLSVDKMGSTKEVFEKIASIELNSSHPISNAFMEWKHENPFDAYEVESFKENTGKGLEGYIDGQKFNIGSRKYIESICEINNQSLTEVELLLNQKQVVVYVAIDDVFHSYISLTDKMKNGVEQAIQKLHDAGIETMMITGDNQVTAKAIADSVGIDAVRAEVTPSQKADIVKELQDQGKFVAFIGDGINDAIALKQSDLSISMGDGSDLAISSSDVTLLNSNILQLGNAIKLSKSTLSKVKQNLFISFSYNTVAVFLAAMGYIPPIFAALAMTVESVSVVYNTLRLNKIKLD